MAIEMLKTSDLRRRGWTDSLITMFLPKPDDTTPNQQYRTKVSMKLYKLTRVARIEKTKRFVAQKQITDQRKVTAKATVAPKKAKMMQYVENVTVESRADSQAAQ